MTKGGEGHYPCSVCGNALVFVNKYELWYCRTCKEYRKPSTSVEEVETTEALEELSEGGRGKAVVKLEEKGDAMKFPVSESSFAPVLTLT